MGRLATRPVPFAVRAFGGKKKMLYDIGVEEGESNK
jgi:hypothetical protein